MSLLQYNITNNSANIKVFSYYSASAYYNITVPGFDTVSFMADDTFPPQQINVGLTEDQFLTGSFFPTDGFAWLWNDGEKVKHIKISNLSANGNNINSFIQNSDWIKFLLTEARDNEGNYIHPSSSLTPQLEQYILDNSTNVGSYSLLRVNESSPLTSEAVSSANSSYLDFNFTASGNIITYDTASGTIVEPVFNPSPDPQGYFPKNIGDENINEQYFKTWNNVLLDSLGFFNTSSGVYTFGAETAQLLEINPYIVLTGSTPPIGDASDYGDAEYSGSVYGGTGITPTAITWETASLRLYINDILAEESTQYITDISESIIISSSFNYSPSVNDTLKVSLFITGSETNKNQINSALLSTEYSMSISASTPPASALVPTYFNNIINVIDDCDPLINNVVEDRTNPRLMDVDYSVDASNPINFNQLINYTAEKSTIPESNYTQLGMVASKYGGSSTSRENINEYNPSSTTDVLNKKIYTADIIDSNLINKGKGTSLGKIPNVELRNAFIGYFDEIIDPYPTLNNKTAYYIKYLIDESGNVLEPSLSDINYSILTNTFKLYDYDLKPTRANISVQNIEESKELSKLTKGITSVYKVGEYPSPILYTQTSSIGHANNIILSGSPFYGTLGLDKTFTNFGSNIFASQSGFPQATGDGLNNTDLALSQTLLDFNSTDISLFDDSVGVYATSSNVNGAIFFPLDSNAETPSTAGADLSDVYRVDGTFEFFSSAIPPRYKRRSGNSNSDDVWRDYLSRAVDYGGGYPDNPQPLLVNLYPYIKTNTDNPDDSGDYISSLTDFNINSITLTIYLDAGEADEVVLQPLELSRTTPSYGNQWTIDNTNKRISINPKGLYIEELVIQNILGVQDIFNRNARLAAREYLFGTWFREAGGNVDGWGGRTVTYKWSVNFTQSNVKQASGLYLKTEGELLFAYDGGDRDDIFALTGVNSVGETLQKHSRTFTPDMGNGFNTQPVIKYTVTSPLAGANNNQNGAPAPYWRRIPSGSEFTNNSLYMSSSILNQAYAILDENGNTTNGNYYIQGKLDYIPGPSTDFPLTQEPSFIEFDPVTDPWSLQIGDEIRFENNENFTYTIESIKEPSNITDGDISDKLQVTLSPPFVDSEGNTKVPSNFDFFVVRRYKENRNFIILDQQKPYGFPVSQSSSPGIILPQYRTDQFNINPDLVLKDLIEKSII